jgi:hypothetical protein
MGASRRPSPDAGSAARIPSKKTVDGFDFSFQPTLSERRLRELADLSGCREPAPLSCFSALQEQAKPDQLTTPIELIMTAPEATVTVVDPRHPLFGRTLPCVGIANSSHRGRCCIVWIRPTVERHVPVSATNLEYHPNTLFPLPISVESLQQFLQEFLLVSGGWKGDPTHDDSTAACLAGSAYGNTPAPDQADQGLDDAHAGATNRCPPGVRHDVPGMSTSNRGGQP